MNGQVFPGIASRAGALVQFTFAQWLSYQKAALPAGQNIEKPFRFVSSSTAYDRSALTHFGSYMQLDRLFVFVRYSSPCKWTKWFVVNFVSQTPNLLPCTGSEGTIFCFPAEPLGIHLVSEEFNV